MKKSVFYLCLSFSMMAHSFFISPFLFLSNIKTQSSGKGYFEVSLDALGEAGSSSGSHTHSNKLDVPDDDTPQEEIASSPLESAVGTGKGHGEGEGEGMAPAGGYGENEVDVPARLKFPPRLRYPIRAREDGIESDVEILLRIDLSGRVLHAEVIRSGGSGFDEAALEAAYKLTFTPAELDGRAVPVHIHWTCRFRLED